MVGWVGWNIGLFIFPVEILCKHALVGVWSFEDLDLYGIRRRQGGSEYQSEIWRRHARGGGMDFLEEDDSVDDARDLF